MATTRGDARLSGASPAIVEAAIKVDGLDFGVKAVENTEELSQDAAGGVAVFASPLPAVTSSYC